VFFISGNCEFETGLLFSSRNNDLAHSGRTFCSTIAVRENETALQPAKFFSERTLGNQAREKEDMGGNHTDVQPARTV